MKLLVKKWVKALRSGKYKQGHGALIEMQGEERKKIKTYCCLGVLCDVSGLGRWTKTYKYKVGIKKLDSNGDVAPEKVQKAAGITLKFQRHLAQLNDEDQEDFIEIAIVIEAYMKDPEAWDKAHP
jgi:hypothetical protein